MPQIKVPLETATRDQLFEFATATLGLDVRANASETVLRAKIGEAHTANEITVEAVHSADPDEPVRKPRSDAATEAAKPRKMVKITLAVDRDSGGRDPLPVSVNGRQMLIPRGTPCEVPFEFFHVIQNAVKIEYRQDPPGEGQMVATMVPVYNYTVHATAA